MTRRLLAEWGPLVPFALCAGGLLLGAAAWLVRSSFAGTDGGWSLQPWRDVLGSALNRRAVATSVKLSALVATICTVAGVPLALLIAGLGRKGRTAVQAALNVVTNFGGASLAIAMITAYGAVGFVRLALEDLFGVGLMDLFGFGGLIAVYVYFILPLYVLLLLPATGALRREWREAVEVSSGTPWHFWRHVGVPVLFPFVLAAWVLTFAWSIGQFSVPFALLGEVPSTPLMTTRLGDYLFSATGGSNRFQRAAALSVLLVAFSALALALYRAIAAPRLRRLEGSA
jgi:ABC-type uncharacterized transport system permease subunit